MRRLLALFLLVPAILSAQTPDSTSTYTSVHTDSVKSWYTRTIHDTTWVHDTATPPPPVAMGCPATGWSRRLAVSPSTLKAALATAGPGDQFEMADGSYGAVSVSGKNGTATDSVTLCGTRKAVTGALTLTSVAYWRVLGFRVNGGLWCAQFLGVTHSRVEGTEVSGCGQEGYVIKQKATDNLFRGNWCHDTGKSSPQWGECFYVGDGSSNADASDRNVLDGNITGPNGTAEHYDIKRGTTDVVVRNATGDATGFVCITTGSQVTTSIVVTGGKNTIFQGITMSKVNAPACAVFQAYGASGVKFIGDAAQGTYKLLYSIQAGNGTWQ